MSKFLDTIKELEDDDEEKKEESYSPNSNHKFLASTYAYDGISQVYKEAKEEADKHYDAAIKGEKDRNKLTDLYMNFNQRAQQASESNDFNGYLKNYFLAQDTAEGVSDIGSGFTKFANKLGDLGESAFLGIRNTVGSIGDTLYSTSLNLDYLFGQTGSQPVLTLDPQVLYTIAKSDSSQEFAERVWQQAGADELARLSIQYPSNKDINKLYDIVSNRNYKGSLDSIKTLTNNIKEYVREQKYADFRNEYSQNAKSDNERRSVKAELTYDGFDKAVMNAWNTVGGMVPAIGASLATGSALGALGWGSNVVQGASTAASLTTLGAGAYGNAFNEALDAGNPWVNSGIYASLVTAAEVGSEVLGGEAVNSLLFTHTVSTPAGQVAKAIVDKLGLKSTLARGTVARLLDVGAEGFEEMLTQALDPVFKSLALEDNSGWEDYGESVGRAFIESILPTIILGSAGRVQMSQEIDLYGKAYVNAIQQSKSLTDEQKGEMLRGWEKAVKDAKAGFTQGYVELRKSITDQLNEADLKNIDTLTYALETSLNTDMTEEEKRAEIQRYAREHGGIYNESQATTQELKDTSKKVTVSYNDMPKIDAALNSFRSRNPNATIETVSDINEVQSTIKDLVERITGKQVVYVNPSSTTNTYYGFMNDDGNVYINSNLNAKDTLGAANHEIGHYVKTTNPDLYNEFVKKANLTPEKIDNYRKQVDDSLTDDQVKEEMFGDYIGEVMSKYKNTKTVEQSVLTLWDKVKRTAQDVGSAVLGTEKQGRITDYNLSGLSYLGGDILNDTSFEEQVLETFKSLKNVDQVKEATKKTQEILKTKPESTTQNVQDDAKSRIEEKYKQFDKKLVNMKTVKEMIANELGVEYNDPQVDKIYKQLRDYGEIGERIKLSERENKNDGRNNSKTNRDSERKESSVSRGLHNNGLLGKLLGKGKEYTNKQNTENAIKGIDRLGNEDGLQDSKGRKLSKGVISYFKNSTVVNKNGELLVLYHGSPNPQFFVFDKEKLGSNGSTIAPMFDFSTIESFSKSYVEENGSFYEVYLNIENPYILKEGDKTFVELQDEANKEGLSFIDYMEKLGYDGVKINDNFWGAFEPEQIKLTTNLNPTSNPDIRYSSRKVGANDTNITNEGNTIPWGLVNWAKRSQARDGDNLVEYYHGSPFAKDESFDQFKPRYRHNGAALGDGYYLTRSYNRALSYSDMENTEGENADDYVKTFIVNTLNPLDISEPKRVKAQILRNFDSMIETFNPEFGGGNERFGTWRRVPYVEDMKEMLEEDNNDDEWFTRFVGDFVPELAKVNYTNEYGVEETEYIDTREIYKYLGFDSIMDYSDIVIFESNQAKYLDNANPTTDSRFAYSSRKESNTEKIINNQRDKIASENTAKEKWKGKAKQTQKENKELTKQLKKDNTSYTRAVKRKGKQIENLKIKGVKSQNKIDELRYTRDALRKINKGIESTYKEQIRNIQSESNKMLKTGRNQELKMKGQLEREGKKYNKLSEAMVDLKLERELSAKAKSDGITFGREYKDLYIGLRRTGDSANDAYALTRSIFDESQTVNRSIDNSINILKELRKRKVYNKLPSDIKSRIDEYANIWTGSREQSNLTLAKRVLTSLTARELRANGVNLAKSVRDQIMSEEGYGWENGKGSKSLQELFNGSKEVAQAFEQELIKLRQEVADFQARDFLEERTKQLADTIIKMQDEVGEEIGKQKKGFKKNVLKTNNTILSSLMTLKTEIQALMGGNGNTALMQINNNLQKGEMRKKQAVVDVYNILSDFMQRSSGINYALNTERWSPTLEKSLSNKSKFVDTGMVAYDNNGKKTTIKIPRSMMMSLAMHLLNEDNMSHISGAATKLTTDDSGNTKIQYGRGQGVRIPDETLFRAGKEKEAYDSGVTVRLLEEQVEAIANMLTEEEKAFVKAVGEVFKHTSELINEVSNRIVGYDMATVENYFPIRVWDRGQNKGAVLNAPMQKMYGEALTQMLNPGWLQERVTSFNPIYLENIAEVMNRVVNNVSNFYGYAEALRDNHILLDSTMPNGTEFSKSIDDLSSSFMSNYNKLTRFITGMESLRDGRFRSLMAMNTLTFNIGTWLTQPMSFFNTIKYFSGKEFLSSINPVNNNLKLNKMIRNYFDEIGLDHTQYNDYQVARAFIAMATPNLENRAIGYKIPELNQLFNKNLQAKIGAHGIDAFDNIAVTAIARMMAYSVSLDPNIKFGSEEYFDVLGERLTQVLVETQPEFSHVNRANMFRSSNGLLRMLSLFGTPANQMFNNFTQSAMQFAYEAREGKVKGQTAANLIKSASGIALSSVLVGLVRALRDTVRGGDDDDTEFADRWIAESVIAMLGPTLILDDVAQFVMGQTKYGGMNSYDFNTPETTFANGIQNLGEKILQLGKEDVSPAKKTRDIIRAMGVITPIDTKSMVRIVEALMKFMTPDMYKAYSLQTDSTIYKQWLKNSDSDMATFYTAYTATRTKVLEEKYGYHKADKSKGIKSNLKESREKALTDVLKDKSEVKKYMEILFDYKS